MSQLVRLQERVSHAWANQDWDEWTRTCAPDYRFDSGVEIRFDRDGALAWSKAFFTAFPDYTERVLRVYAAGDTTVAEIDGTGSSLGALAIPGRPPLPATGKTFRIRYAKVLTYRDDLVVWDRQYFDRLGLFTQLGYLPG